MAETSTIEMRDRELFAAMALISERANGARGEAESSRPRYSRDWNRAAEADLLLPAIELLLTVVFTNIEAAHRMGRARA